MSDKRYLLPLSWQDTFFQSSKNFGYSLIKNDIIYMHLPFIHKTALF